MCNFNTVCSKAHSSFLNWDTMCTWIRLQFKAHIYNFFLFSNIKALETQALIVSLQWITNIGSKI